MRGLQKLMCAARRVVLLSLTMVFIVTTANAYTIIMRGGRRVEISDRFVVTQTTLTYEVSPGIQVTLTTASIDIPSTEKANHETPGSFLKRAQLSAAEKTMARAGIRTITNRDLEPAARRRQQSELAYENRRKKLGLPSMEETRRQAAAKVDQLHAELTERRVAEGETENYWRGRAENLRTEMAALDSEIRYVRTRLEEMPAINTGVGVTSFGSVVPFGSFGGFGLGHQVIGGHRVMGAGRPVMGARNLVMGSTVFRNSDRGLRIVGRTGFRSSGMRGGVFGGFGHRRSNSIGFGFPTFGGTVFGSPLNNNYGYGDYSYERSELITRFNELSATRAGMAARWRELEDEARRAGAPPGWLRK